MGDINETGINGLRRISPIPGTIRDLLRRFIERKVVIVLDAEVEPELVEIENVVGDLLIAEFGNKFIFVK